MLPPPAEKLQNFFGVFLQFQIGVDSRILSYDEIVDAEKDLHVAFKEMGMLPLVDCGENDFIVYHFIDKSWSKFNIVDETSFKKGSTFEELLK